MTSSIARLCLRILAVMLAAGALAACETTGTGAPDVAAKPVEVPMTGTRAAELCWMSTEKANASLPLDKRADIVNKCIEQKMNAGSGNSEPAPAAPAEAKKKKPAAAAADAKSKKPAAAPPREKDEKDKKPADAEAPDNKP
jgi:hypothetical protein